MFRPRTKNKTQKENNPIVVLLILICMLILGCTFDIEGLSWPCRVIATCFLAYFCPTPPIQDSLRG